MIPSSEMLTMSFQQYDQFLKESKLSTNQAEANMVKRIGGNIKQAVEKYMSDHAISGRLRGYHENSI